MNCGWREQAALYAGGDLAEKDAPGVERHLAECAGCRSFAEELRADLAALRDEHLRPINPSQYVVLRGRVMERVRGERAPFGWWKAAWAAGALAAAAFLLLPAPKPTIRGRVAARATPAAVAAEVAAAPRRVESSRRRRIVHRAAARPLPKHYAQSGPIVVKLLTNDPNIVIYWITDNKGDYQ